MKKFYDKYLRVDENKPISNKVFLTRILLSISIIVCCLSMTTYTAYAYFSTTISSKNNSIVSASYSLSVESKQGLTNNNNTFELKNTSTENKEYHFLVTPSTSSNATVGFAKVIIKQGDNVIDKYYTNPIGKETEGFVSKRAFVITLLPQTTYTVQFIAEWGSCSQTAIGDTGDVREISLDTYANIQVVVDEIEEQVDDIVEDAVNDDLNNQGNNDTLIHDDNNQNNVDPNLNQQNSDVNQQQETSTDQNIDSNNQANNVLPQVNNSQELSNPDSSVNQQDLTDNQEQLDDQSNNLDNQEVDKHSEDIPDNQEVE